MDMSMVLMLVFVRLAVSVRISMAKHVMTFRSCLLAEKNVYALPYNKYYTFIKFAVIILRGRVAERA